MSEMDGNPLLDAIAARFDGGVVVRVRPDDLPALARTLGCGSLTDGVVVPVRVGQAERRAKVVCEMLLPPGQTVVSPLSEERTVAEDWAQARRDIVGWPWRLAWLGVGHGGKGGKGGGR